MNKFGFILPFACLAKEHEKANKGNSVEPFVYWGARRASRAYAIKKKEEWL